MRFEITRAARNMAQVSRDQSYCARFSSPPAPLEFCASAPSSPGTRAIRLSGWSVGWLDGWLAGWLACLLTSRPSGLLAGWRNLRGA